MHDEGRVHTIFDFTLKEVFHGYFFTQIKLRVKQIPHY